MSLWRSAFNVGGLTFLSRIVGYARDIQMAAAVGTGPLAEAFLIAFRLPNLFRQLFAEGAFNSAFVPIYTSLRAEDEDTAQVFLRHVFSLMCVALLIFSAFMLLFMPVVMIGLATGFRDSPEQFSMTVSLSRITFPYLFMVTLVAVLGGALNSMKRFSAAAAAPILMNFAFIFGFTIFSPFSENAAFALAYSVLLGGFLQLIWIFWQAKRCGILPRLVVPNWRDSNVSLLFKRMIPGILGAGVMQLNVWVNTLIATMIPGAVAYLYFADRLSQFPLALIGTALGTVLLPTIAAQLKGGKREECLHTQEQAFLLSQTLTLPAAAGLLVLAQPIIVALFARGEFSLDAAAATAKALQAYSLGLPAFVLVKLYAPMYFAQGDTRTPVKFAFICLLLNVCLNLLSVRWFGHFGLALSTSFCSWVNVFLLALGLRKSGLLALSKDSMRKFFKLLLATIFMGLSVEFLELALEKELSSHWLRLAICCSVGGILYGLAVLLLRIYNPLQLKKLLRRR